METTTEPQAKAPSPEEVARIVKTADLVSINLQSCQSRAYLPPHMVEGAQLTLSGESSVKWARTEDKRNLLCYIGLTVKAIKAPKDATETPAPQAEPIFDVNATCCAIYYMNEAELSDAAIEIFAQTTAVFNSYPYLREFVDQTSRRMGFRPVSLPLMKLGKKA